MRRVKYDLEFQTPDNAFIDFPRSTLEWKSKILPSITTTVAMNTAAVSQSCCQTMNEKARRKSSSDKNMLVFSYPEIIFSIFCHVFILCVFVAWKVRRGSSWDPGVSFLKPRLFLLRDRIKSDDKKRKSIIKSKQIELKNFLFLSQCAPPRSHSNFMLIYLQVHLICWLFKWFNAFTGRKFLLNFEDFCDRLLSPLRLFSAESER